MAKPRKLNILIIHGIGWGDRGTKYARPLQDNIRREFDRAIRRLRLRDVSKRAARAKRALRFEPVNWDPVTQQPQDSLLHLMFGRPGLFRRFNLTYHFRRNMVGLLGDVIAYESAPDNKVYQAIHGEVDRCVTRLSEASKDERGADGYAPLTVIGHSLGSVIGSDYVWDHTRSSDHSHYLTDHNFALVNYVAMGSPMALYALRNNAYGGRASIRESLDSPVKVDPDRGLWLNLYDRQDAIAFPLEPIEAYKSAGVLDYTVNAGSWLTSWNLLSHTGYWRSDRVAQVIARKLALDWARLNSPHFVEHNDEKAWKNFSKELKKR